MARALRHYLDVSGDEADAPLADSPQTDDTLDFSDEQLAEAYSGLDARQRQILEYCAIRFRTVREAGVELGVSAATVSRRAKLARLALQQALGIPVQAPVAYFDRLSFIHELDEWDFDRLLQTFGHDEWRLAPTGDQALLAENDYPLLLRVAWHGRTEALAAEERDDDAATALHRRRAEYAERILLAAWRPAVSTFIEPEDRESSDIELIEADALEYLSSAIRRYDPHNERYDKDHLKRIRQGLRERVRYMVRSLRHPEVVSRNPALLADMVLSPGTEDALIDRIDGDKRLIVLLKGLTAQEVATLVLTGMEGMTAPQAAAYMRWHGIWPDATPLGLRNAKWSARKKIKRRALRGVGTSRVAATENKTPEQVAPEALTISDRQQVMRRRMGLAAFELAAGAIDGLPTTTELRDRFGDAAVSPATSPPRLSEDDVMMLLAVNRQSRASLATLLSEDENGNGIAKRYYAQRSAYAENLLCGHYLPRLRRVARSGVSDEITGSGGVLVDGEMTEALIRAVRTYDPLRAGQASNFTAYLVKIFRNKEADAYRAVKRRGVTVVDMATQSLPASSSFIPEKTVVADQLSPWLVQALQSLPVMQRTLIVLTELDGLSYEEAAIELHRLGLSKNLPTPGTLRVTKHRALSKLRGLGGAPATDA
ncbi:sigma-70 family RNA polymerase sigma factor [Candidatus Saccharibacteria bacterium]|nr:sigma-70 family RNA polymerase sigma factor [Candidatus Saccharibacteria bacterium]